MIFDIKDTDSYGYIERVKSVVFGKNKYAHVITLGCQQNEADSEKIRTMAAMMGYEITDDASLASMIVINTCAIREHAELKALSILGKFKEKRREDPDAVVALVGCMAAEEKVTEKLKNRYHQVSFTLEPSQLHRFPEMTYRALVEKKRSFALGTESFDIVEGITPHRASDYRAWVSVMYGCNNFCSYCIVPYVRGRERSRESSAVIAECRELIESGYREITLLGQNVNSYKSDMDFASLLEAVATIPGDFTVRFMTSHPKDASDRLIEVMGKYPDKIAPHFHLPLQSGSDAVLKSMNRTYDTSRFLSIVEKLRRTVPKIALTTDVIVGFPGESEEDFLDTLNVLEKVRFDMVYSFIYSAREGTLAAKMENRIDEAIKGERMRRLLKLQDGISLEKNAEYIGRVERVLVDSPSKRGDDNLYSGRTLTNKRVHFTCESCRGGEFVNVKINRAGPFDLFGEIRKEKEND